jgi:hypothetical protein
MEHARFSPRAGYPGLMWKKHLIFLAVLLVAVAGDMAWLILREPPEPVYQGKRLSDWLVELDKEMPPSNYVSVDSRAAVAIQEMGTNTLPFLRRLLKARDTRLKTTLVEFARKQGFIRIRFTLANDLHRRAALAAFCLGPRGSSLMPEIMALFRARNYQDAFTVTEVLGRIGYCNAETLPTLLAALNEPPNTSPDFHGRAAFAFMQLYTCMEIVNVERPDAFHEPAYEAAVPALLKALNAPNDMPLAFGATLKPYCGTILKRIDPEVAAKAGVK